MKLVNRLTIRPATLPDGDFPRGVRGRRTDFRLVSVIIFPSVIRPTFQCFTFTADHVANDPLVIGRKVVLFVFDVGDDQQDDPELFKIDVAHTSRPRFPLPHRDGANRSFRNPSVPATTGAPRGSAMIANCSIHRSSSFNLKCFQSSSNPGNSINVNKSSGCTSLGE